MEEEGGRIGGKPGQDQRGREVGRGNEGWGGAGKRCWCGNEIMVRRGKQNHVKNLEKTCRRLKASFKFYFYQCKKKALIYPVTYFLTFLSIIIF